MVRSRQPRLRFENTLCTRGKAVIGAALANLDLNALAALRASTSIGGLFVVYVSAGVHVAALVVPKTNPEGTVACDGAPCPQ